MIEYTAKNPEKTLSFSRITCLFEKKNAHFEKKIPIFEKRTDFFLTIFPRIHLYTYWQSVPRITGCPKKFSSMFQKNFCNFLETKWGKRSALFVRFILFLNCQKINRSYARSVVEWLQIISFSSGIKKNLGKYPQ